MVASWFESAVLLSTLSVAACSSSVEPASKPHSTPTPLADASTADAGAITTMDITVGSFVFHARVAGPEDGQLVLLLHGFPETSYEWRRQLPALAKAGYRAVAPDQRGYSPGARPETVDDYNVLNLATDVVGMADALGAKRFHVVGHDWGAGVAWVVAKAAADRVITVNTLSVPHPDAFATVLADPTSCQYTASAYFDTFSAPNSEDALLANDDAGLRALYTGVDEDAIDEYVRVLGTKDALGAALNWYRANFAGRMIKAPKLGAIGVPTMYIWSDADTALCKDGADLTANYVTGPYEFDVLHGVNHWIADTDSAELTPLLLAHLGKFKNWD